MKENAYAGGAKEFLYFHSKRPDVSYLKREGLELHPLEKGTYIGATEPMPKSQHLPSSTSRKSPRDRTAEPSHDST